MESIQGKKILILGGSALMVDPVIKAKNMGLYTIVTDWHELEKSPAKQIADEYWNISLMDYDLLTRKIKEENIEGILTGFSDAFLLAYQHLCELTGLPCYATKEVFEITMDKARFKQLCRDYDVPVIPEYRLDDFDPSSISPSNKVIIKPVDNSGSLGVILCEKEEDFDNCLQYALSFSKKKQVVIEKYMEMDSISISYIVQDGSLSLSTTDDRYVHKAPSGSSVTCLSLYPSKYTDVYLKKMDAKVRNMYEKAGLRNGPVSIQFFTNGIDFYAMEMGHRLTGGQHYIYTKYENDISVLERLIYFSITGRMADYCIAEHDNPRFKHTYCHLFILGKEGKIARMEGRAFLEKLPEAIHIEWMKNVNDTVGVDGTGRQKIVGLHIKVDDMEQLNNVIHQIQTNFHIYDEDGNDLTLKIGE